MGHRAAIRAARRTAAPAPEPQLAGDARAETPGRQPEGRRRQNHHVDPSGRRRRPGRYARAAARRRPAQQRRRCPAPRGTPAPENAAAGRRGPTGGAGLRRAARPGRAQPLRSRRLFRRRPRRSASSVGDAVVRRQLRLPRRRCAAVPGRQPRPAGRRLRRLCRRHAGRAAGPSHPARLYGTGAALASGASRQTARHLADAAGGRAAGRPLGARAARPPGRASLRGIHPLRRAGRPNRRKRAGVRAGGPGVSGRRPVPPPGPGAAPRRRSVAAPAGARRCPAGRRRRGAAATRRRRGGGERPDRPAGRGGLPTRRPGRSAGPTGLAAAGHAVVRQLAGAGPVADAARVPPAAGLPVPHPTRADRPRRGPTRRAEAGPGGSCHEPAVVCRCRPGRGARRRPALRAAARLHVADRGWCGRGGGRHSAPAPPGHGAGRRSQAGSCRRRRASARAKAQEDRESRRP